MGAWSEKCDSSIMWDTQSNKIVFDLVGKGEGGIMVFRRLDGSVAVQSICENRNHAPREKNAAKGFFSSAGLLGFLVGKQW